MFYFRDCTVFDDYPYILLNLILSCVAALQAPVITMSQKRQEAKDRLCSQRLPHQSQGRVGNSASARQNGPSDFAPVAAPCRNSADANRHHAGNEPCPKAIVREQFTVTTEFCWFRGCRDMILCYRRVVHASQIATKARTTDRTRRTVCCRGPSTNQGRNCAARATIVPCTAVAIPT
jgi:hypothetical protein